ncbi:uncharacterized protein LOC123265273 [Cotesia glomerata]|uniref:uncharacterized protein LOC123265273 n=1 Tax=Cotesia glomerata TaxID=32391 RepID=UPI001D024CCC|nr:uncharacterized protein LOC123265273 [Cotesia glomerata]
MVNGAELNEGNAVTMVASQRLPELVAADPEMWFAMIESQFVRNHITDKQQQYLQVLSSIPSRYATEVRDIIMKPLTAALYDELKVQLIKRLSVSQEEKTRKLLEGEKMGDEKPSQYLRRLQAQAGSSFPDHLLKTLWLRGLPEKYQTAMATQQEKAVTAMAEVADFIHGLLPSRPSIAEVAITRDTQLALTMQQLHLEIAEIKNHLGIMNARGSEAEFYRRGRSQTPHRGHNSQQRPRSRSLQRGPRPPGMCWYH